MMVASCLGDTIIASIMDRERCTSDHCLVVPLFHSHYTFPFLPVVLLIPCSGLLALVRTYMDLYL